ncbi:mitochondrial carnitine/acylcarnitine carrier protein isoform X2 [Anabrus simplex]|uniref:mitochondrial carnitine/acylcarnitine carrier protein isoform X2 n=1 Tax=Anabrus simplex TaxID=316456 RepID=UPI0034DD786E
MPSKEHEAEISSFNYLVSGSVGGALAVLVGHPLDTVKVRLQTMPKIPGEEPMYKGTWDCFVKTLANEGVLGLLRGLTAPLVLVTPMFALWFLGYDWGKRLQMKRPDEELTVPQLLAAGAFSALVTLPVQVPGERIKCVQQAAEATRYQYPLSTIKNLYREGGIRNFYVGSSATLLRELPSTGIYFMTYEELQRILTPEGATEVGVMQTLFSGGVAGIFNWLVAIPPDVLKSRQQAAPVGTYPRGLIDVFTQLIREEGIQALYRGSIPVLIRAFPVNAACFLGFELCLKFLTWLEET